jgi:hypothetical protein
MASATVLFTRSIPMDESREPRQKTDRILLLEVGLGLLLFGLAIYLYWIPAAREPFLPRWWSLPLLAGLFFGILWLNRMRRKRRAVVRRQEAVDDVAREAEERGIATVSRPAPRPHEGVDRRDDEGVAPPERGL